MKYSDDEQIIGTPRYAEYQRTFSEAGYKAAYRAKKLGLPLTYLEDNQIIEEFADGHKEVLGSVEPSFTYPTTTVIQLPNAT
ncbi:hypothetical protein AGMMS49938_03590 [Fibrobacterales bacterium]|nr:hypothetical protein AGMMS49938_03590 [Fibrobacterales bacterium]